MKLKMKKNMLYLFVIILAIVVIYLIFNRTNESSIKKLTDLWIYNVTKKNDAYVVYNMFCSDGNLVGTVSQTIRRGSSILDYFRFFAKLPNIQVIDKKYTIDKITSNVFINTAFVTWKWDGLDEPIIARMSFIFRNNCIYQLHSSALPEVNEELKRNII